jgi:hypothetical protein
MTMFMGIVGHLVSLDDGRRQSSLGLHGFPDCRNRVSIYLGVDHVSRSLQAQDWGHSITPWSDELFESDIQLELDFDDVQHFQLADMPAVAKSLFCVLLRNDEHEPIIGDLNERYSQFYQDFGKRKADLYVYGEVCLSLFPLIKRAWVKSGVRILRELKPQ